jgi:hypothetical protein
MQQPSLFADHEDTKPAYQLSEPQKAALVEIMGQILTTCFARERKRDDHDGSPQNYRRSPRQKGDRVLTSIDSQTGDAQ